MSIEDFYTRMKSLWDKGDALDPVIVCSCKGCECDLQKSFTKPLNKKDYKFFDEIRWQANKQEAVF